MKEVVQKREKSVEIAFALREVEQAIFELTRVYMKIGGGETKDNPLPEFDEKISLADLLRLLPDALIAIKDSISDLTAGFEQTLI